MMEQGRGNTRRWIKDLVCGRPVDTASPAAIFDREWRGVRFSFCSDECAAAFEADPASYLPASASAVVGLTNSGGARLVRMPLGSVSVASALKLDEALSDLTGVELLVVNHTAQKAAVVFDPDCTSVRDVIASVAEAGCNPLVVTLDLPVGGLYCPNCLFALEREIETIRGVVIATANLEREEVTVVYEPQTVRLSALGVAIDRAGYRLDLAAMPAGTARPLAWAGN